jgi:short-subunit dehydrogenase
MKPAIVVTGASSGNGRELARVAAREGSVMVLLDQSQQALEDVVAELGRCGVQAHALCFNLADRDAGQGVEDALSELGVYCDILVNSAGFGVFGPAAEADREEQLSLLDVNARALTELTLRFLPGMVARRRGGILNVGSTTGYVPGPNMAVYYASKAYVRSFTAALTAELAGTGVTVTCLSPGIVRTAFFERAAVGKTRLFKLMPRSNVPEIAEVGWRAFRAGKPLVIPGLTNRVILLVCRLLPDAVVLYLMSALQRPL